MTAFVTALCPDAGAGAGHAQHASLNQAVKSIAVARQYVRDSSASAEVTFLPFLRFDSRERPDPSRFAFLVFKSLGGLGEELKTADQTDLNVSRSSDVNKMANVRGGGSLGLQRQQGGCSGRGRSSSSSAIEGNMDACERNNRPQARSRGGGSTAGGPQMFADMHGGRGEYAASAAQQRHSICWRLVLAQPSCCV